MRTLHAAIVAGAFAASAACNPVDRSVRAWIESRDTAGAIVAGARVEIDGQPSGLTDARGLYRVKIRRRVGEKIQLHVSEEGPELREWSGFFTVSSAGTPSETRGGRVIAVLVHGGT